MKSWRKLLALFFGLAGISSSLALGILTRENASSIEASITAIQAGLTLLGVFSAVISVFVWKGRNWARAALIYTLIAGFFSLVVLSVIDFISTTSSIASGIGNIFFYMSLLIFPALLFMILQHPDVRKEFDKGDQC